MEEFFERVAKKEGQSVDVTRATYHARVVIEALGATYPRRDRGRSGATASGV